MNGEPRPSDPFPPPRTGVRHFEAPASPDHAGVSRTRASAHVLVRRSPTQTARREHPIHTFVIISPRYRRDRESLGILHGMIMVRPSPTPATGIRATSRHSARWPVESTGFFVFARRRGAWSVKTGRGHVVRFWSGRTERRSRQPMDYFVTLLLAFAEHSWLRQIRPGSFFIVPFLTAAPGTTADRFRPGGDRPREGPAVRSPGRGGVLDGFWPQS